MTLNSWQKTAIKTVKNRTSTVYVRACNILLTTLSLQYTSDDRPAGLVDAGWSRDQWREITFEIYKWMLATVAINPSIYIFECQISRNKNKHAEQRTKRDCKPLSILHKAAICYLSFVINRFSYTFVPISLFLCNWKLFTGIFSLKPKIGFIFSFYRVTNQNSGLSRQIAW